MSKKWIDAGSPPCSPQMPILRSGRVLRPRSTPIAHQRADAVGVDRGERILLEDLLVLIDLQELPDVVAREAEGQLRQVVGAEREELRLARRSRSAVIAPRGTSIIVPTRYLILTPCSFIVSAATRSTIAF